MDPIQTPNQIVILSRLRARGRPARLFVLLCLLAVVILSACEDNSSSSSKPPVVSKEPSENDITEAVRRSVNGKTYQVETTKQRNAYRTCSQQDVDLDPNMPRNPELARCPRVGHRYQVTESYTVTETRRCSSLPQAGAEYGWRVADNGKDRWRVSNTGRVWDVSLLGGGAVNIEDAVKVSSFTFKIEPHQDC